MKIGGAVHRSPAEARHFESYQELANNRPDYGRPGEELSDG